MATEHGTAGDLVRIVPWRATGRAEADVLLTREWLVTNGLGGYASGTVAGAVTRRYHALLIAALPAPLGRVVVLDHLSERLRLPDGRVVSLGGEEGPGVPAVHGDGYLADFRLEAGLPVWHFEAGGVVIERRLWMPHLQNTVYISYRLLAGDGPVRLTLLPAVHFRPVETPVGELAGEPYALTVIGDRFELSGSMDLPPLRMQLLGRRTAFTVEARRLHDRVYRLEEARGYASMGDLWSPGYFRVSLSPEQDATFIASTEAWESIAALTPTAALAAERERRHRLLDVAGAAAHDPVSAELVLAADQFIIRPAGRVEDVARAHAAGDDVRAVIAGYHWFTDWGRDTMISLEGLTLATGRTTEAGYILGAFAHYVRDGLIPNFFPDGEREGLYHTADATLWYFHALHRYLRATGDRHTLRLLLPVLREIVEHHLRGTRFGIGVDPADGLLRQGAEGYQLTWMDAKVGDWVVTPRRGKAVEINALWYNALSLLESWVREELGDDPARPYAEHAGRARASFNERFWYATGGYLYDVIDGEDGADPACRPNQLLAIALDHPVLDRSCWQAVLDVAAAKLRTPVGLRSLAPDHPDYKARYFGDLRARDAAYHQGTVWAWLIGPFVDAWLKVHPEDRAGARHFLEGLVPHLGEAGIGSISEIFDAEAPHPPRGCIAQAWSVAEVLRAWLATAPEGQVTPAAILRS